ncbi:MAG: thioredoxin domain-containing protein [Bacteroidales bacterium]|nr:thioredoxin domain-containing protein [Bacteroidales bacterium]
MKKSKKNTNTYNYIFNAVLIIFLAVIAFQLYYMNNKIYTTNILLGRLIVAEKQKSSHDIKYGPNDIIIGQKDAPVDIFIFSSYRCRYCQEFFNTIFPLLKKEYIEEGIAKMIIKNIGSASDSVSLLAVKAAYCAYTEGHFFELHMKLLEQYDVLNETVLSKWMSDLNIDSAKFKDCIDNKKLDELISENRKEARAVGVRGTPSFVIGKNILKGQHQIEKFRELIEEEKELCE